MAVGETEAEVMELIHEAIEFLSKASAMKAKTYHSRDRMSAMSKSSQHKLVQMIVKAYEVHSNNDPEQN